MINLTAALLIGMMMVGNSFAEEGQEQHFELEQVCFSRPDVDNAEGEVRNSCERLQNFLDEISDDKVYFTDTMCHYYTSHTESNGCSYFVGGHSTRMRPKMILNGGEEQYRHRFAPYKVKSIQDCSYFMRILAYELTFQAFIVPEEIIFNYSCLKRMPNGSGDEEEFPYEMVVIVDLEKRAKASKMPKESKPHPATHVFGWSYSTP